MQAEQILFLVLMMNLVKKLLDKMSGLFYPQEYLCLPDEPFTDRLHFNLFEGSRFIADITAHHVLSGYFPLVLSIWNDQDGNPEWPVNVQIIVTPDSILTNEYPSKKDALALITLKRIKIQDIEGRSIAHYEGTGGYHRFIGAYHQFVNGLNNNLFNKKQGNVFLNNALYTQVQVAYALPRAIGLVTVSDGQLFNLFPTDLHGPVGNQCYVDSLRHAGKASDQVLKQKKILISEMDPESYKLVYSLGKNHMQEMKKASFFPFSGQESPTFKLPIPKGAIGYRELELMDHFEAGIHRIFTFRVVNHTVLTEGKRPLAHIHNAYASWRHKKGLKGNYLMR